MENLPRKSPTGLRARDTDMTAMNFLKFLRPQFVQTEVKPPEQQVGKLKLSEAIRLGILFVPELKSYRGCALGCAYFALTRKIVSGEFPYSLSENWETIAILGGWPHELCLQISSEHYRGAWSREQCADYAERQGC